MEAESPSRRRWFQFSLRTLLAVITSCCAVAAVLFWLLMPRPFPDPTKAIVDVEIEFAYDDDKNPYRFQWTDPQFIESAVARPMLGSQRHPSPVPRYVVLGVLRIRYDDGTAGYATIFLPWGCWIHEEQNYRVSDFSALRDECRRVIQVRDPGAPVLKEAWFWSPDPYK